MVNHFTYDNVILLYIENSSFKLKLSTKSWWAYLEAFINRKICRKGVYKMHKFVLCQLMSNTSVNWKKKSVIYYSFSWPCSFNTMCELSIYRTRKLSAFSNNVPYALLQFPVTISVLSFPYRNTSLILEPNKYISNKGKSKGIIVASTKIDLSIMYIEWFDLLFFVRFSTYCTTYYFMEIINVLC